MLRSEDEFVYVERDSIREKIERAFGQFERGEVFTAEESRADMEKRKAVWLSDQKRQCDDFS